MNKELITNLANKALAKNDALFLIEISVSNNGAIEVVVDGDKPVSLKECVRISRYIEQYLDRNTEDFSLKVTTPDITQPLVNIRQYEKNIGRTLIVQTEEKKIEGILTVIKDNAIELEWKAREPKPIGKGKHTVIKKAEIALQDIQKAKVKIIYN